MSVASRLKLLAKLKKKAYRDAYVEEHVKTSLPFQIRALREQREWTQTQLAEALKTTQTAVSRLENPEYGKLSLNSLYKIASAFDVALLVKFVPFSRLLEEFKDASPQALSAAGFEAELPELEEWAEEKEEKPETELTPAAASRVVIEADHLFPGLPKNSTAAHLQFLPLEYAEGTFPTAVSKRSKTRTQERLRRGGNILTAEPVVTEKTEARKVAGGRNG